MNDDATNLCEPIDVYLNGELLSTERTAFEIHLEQCAACRETVDQQAWIDALLRSDVAADVEAPQTVLLRPKSRARRWVVPAAAAAAVAAVAALLLLPRRMGTGEGLPPVVEHTRPKTEVIVRNPSPSPSLRRRETSEPPAAAFVSSGAAIAIPVASADPQITIVKLYPTLTAARRWERERALHVNFNRPDGG
jgi:anti-sigma factor RsiW